MPRNTAQQLYDVGYVVYRGKREEWRDGGRRRRKGKRKADANKEEKEKKERQTRKCKFNGKRGTDKKVTCKKM